MSSLMNFRFSLLAGILLLTMFSTVQWVPEEAEAATPTVTLALDQSTKTAKVEPGETGLVVFTGTVEANSVGPGSNVQWIRVDLTATSENGWAVTISPSSIVFPSTGGSTPFTLSVRVPPATSYRVTDNVVIGGRASTIPGALATSIPDTRCTVLVEQYYRFSLECSKPYVMVSPASQLVFSIKVNNEGNGLDKFAFDIGNLESLSDKKFTVQLSTTSIEIEERESQTIKIQVSTPVEIFIPYLNDLTSIKILVASYGSEQVAGLPLQEDYFVYVRQKGYHIPAFDMMPAIFALVVVATMLGAMMGGNVRRRRR